MFFKAKKELQQIRPHHVKEVEKLCQKMTSMVGFHFVESHLWFCGRMSRGYGFMNSLINGLVVTSIINFSSHSMS